MAGLFPCGYSNRESFLPYADMWTGWLTWLSFRQGWETEKFTFSPSFHYIIFNKQVFNVLGLTLTLYQYNLDFTDLYFYLYWKNTKSLSTHSSTTKTRRKRTWVALRLSCHSSIITFESTLYKSRLPELHFGGRIAVRRKGEGCAVPTKLC